MTTPSDVVRELVVPVNVEPAFELFTDRIGEWWPLGEFGLYGPSATVAFRDGRLLESAAGRPDVEWGRVLRWDRPGVVAFSWYPGHGPERASEVTVTFTADPAGTRVHLVHTGWQVFADPAAARSQYDAGWPVVLAPFEALCAAEASSSTLRP